MAAQTPPYAIQASSHGAELFRRAFGTLVEIPQKGGVVLSSAVLLSEGLAVSQNGTPNMSVNVAEGEAWVLGSSTANQGPYYCFNDATVNLAISASNPTNPRIDMICATVNDAAYAGSTNNWVLQVVTGTPTSGATLSNLSGAPAVPASSIVLAYVLVPANATSVVTADLLDVRAPSFYDTRASGQVLSSALLPPFCRVYRNAAFSTAAGTVPFDTIAYDTHRGYSTSTHLYTVPESGLYAVNANYSFSSNAAGQIAQVALVKSGTAWANGEATWSVSPGTLPLASNASDLLVCAAGDTISVSNLGGSPLTGTPGIAATYMSILKVA